MMHFCRRRCYEMRCCFGCAAVWCLPWAQEVRAEGVSGAFNTEREHYVDAGALALATSVRRLSSQGALKIQTIDHPMSSCVSTHCTWIVLADTFGHDRQIQISRSLGEAACMSGILGVSHMFLCMCMLAGFVGWPDKMDMANLDTRKLDRLAAKIAWVRRADAVSQSMSFPADPQSWEPIELCVSCMSIQVHVPDMGKTVASIGCAWRCGCT